MTTCCRPADVTFQHEVEDFVLAAVQTGAQTFRQLLFALPSVYPSLALRAAQRLSSDGCLPPSLAVDMVSEATAAPADSDAVC